MRRPNAVKQQIGKDILDLAKEALELGQGLMKHVIARFVETVESIPFIASPKGAEHPPEPLEMAPGAASIVGRTAVFSGANSSLSSERIVTTGTSADDVRTRNLMEPTIPTAYSAEILSQSSADEVDKCLENGLPLTRNNPTAAILVKVDSANALKYEGSWLYQNEEGKWVADLVPEKIAESDAPSTKIMGDRIVSPTPTIV